MKNKVLIILSTYNGEKFLREQLDSLYAQKDVEIHILVRDDGSKDSTIEILEQYQQKYGNMTILANKNVGAKKSFHSLILEAKNKFPEYDYYSFCDQDDRWLEQKLKVATDALDKLDDKYKMYFSAMTSVDSNLAPLPIKKEVMAINNLYANMTSGRIAGCTQVFNFAILEKASLLSREIVSNNEAGFLPYHDWWVASISYCLSDNIIYDNESYILYRQHGGNAVGSQHNSFVDRLKRFVNTKQRIFRPIAAGKLMSYIGNEISEEKKAFLRKVISYKENPLNTISLMFDNRMYQYPADVSIPLFFIILLRKF